ncbi:MAG: hypothetical protein WKF74_14515 [Pyrinomonadaceae bacterium]
MLRAFGKFIVLVETGKKLDELLRELPDAAGARNFYERFATEHSRAARLFERDEGLLSDALALAAWSPLLATTLLQNPDYLQWLARERRDVRIKSTEELGESLGRFAHTHTSLDGETLLARFRRRELLRITLRDIRRTTTLVEIIEELSNLADAVLAYALSSAAQEWDNRYGAPLYKDDRGRERRAEFCIVALGKLGSRELNYASDIDLLFLYSDEGTTAPTGARAPVTNREYFNKLGERTARLVGGSSAGSSGEAGAYRVDLRLRPYGRVGALSCSLAEAVRYYNTTAEAWELQALIRARAAAGAGTVYARFAEDVRGRVYRSSETIAGALSHVRTAKEKIDREHNTGAGEFNVKLGRGGVREIEFIAQALQLAFGGRDVWLQRAPHTLVSLGRLADRGLITERERSALFDAYTFLRTLEHRLQIEHGLQTHTVPDEAVRRTLVARRMHCTGEHALEDFNRALAKHTTNVRRAFDRVFGAEEVEKGLSPNAPPSAQLADTPVALSDSGDATQDFAAAATSTEAIAQIFHAHLVSAERDGVAVKEIAELVRAAASDSLNERRALWFAARVAQSLDKYERRMSLTERHLEALVRLCGASEFFGEMIAHNPRLIQSLPVESDNRVERSYEQSFQDTLQTAESFGERLAALRRAWVEMLVDIGARDAAHEISMIESNRLQSRLAVASINAALSIAMSEIKRRSGAKVGKEKDENLLDVAPTNLPLAVLGLGRLGGGGTDYGSDLDLVIVYNGEAPSPVHGLTHREAYARIVETLVAALSSVTREGGLYRVDLRLRPDGKNGLLVNDVNSFLDYLQNRAAVWEWLAYVKLHHVAGDTELGREVEKEARRVIHEAAQKIERNILRDETRRVRERLQRERGAITKSHIDIKFGAGGMLDVYFAARYLQLRDHLPDEAEDRSTLNTIARLRRVSSLDDESGDALQQGYTLLRTLDHHLRLLVGRSTRLPVADTVLLNDLARLMNFASPAALIEELQLRMSEVRRALERITDS